MANFPSVEALPPAARSLRQWLSINFDQNRPELPENAEPLLRNLWMVVQRRRAVYDWLIERRCRRCRPATRQVLWWALAECYDLQGLPQAVAVSLAVDGARRQERSFVNGVLRGMLRECPDATALDELIQKEAPPAVQAGLPQPLWQRWKNQMGINAAMALGRLLQQNAPITARPRGCFGGDKGRGPWQGGVFRESQGDLSPQGWYMQDPSTILAPLLLNPRPGEILADLCCAPGGKSLIIAERLEGKGRLICRDRSSKRLQQVQENLSGFSNVEIAVGDGTAPGMPPESLDGVLLDVPCSNTGVIRRRPDVRWNFSAAGLKELLTLQRAILEGAAPLPRIGGRLVYSTCSIEKDENIRQVEGFLAEHPEYKLLRSHQLMPTSAHDGAFVALLQRMA